MIKLYVDIINKFVLIINKWDSYDRTGIDKL